MTETTPRQIAADKYPNLADFTLPFPETSWFFYHNGFAPLKCYYLLTSDTLNYMYTVHVRERGRSVNAEVRVKDQGCVSPSR